MTPMIHTPPPGDMSRAARLIRAQIDGDTNKATQVFAEVSSTEALIDLCTALGFITYGTLRIATRGNVEYMRGYIDDLILKAQADGDTR